MWFAVAIIGMIAIATGITLLPNSAPNTNSPPVAAPAPQPSPMPAQPAAEPKQP